MATKKTKTALEALESPSDEGLSAISGFKIEKTDKGVIWPTVDENFFVKSEHKKMLDAVESLAAIEPQNLMTVGPTGCGKTEMGIWFAATHERPCLLMNCATIRETKDWFGYRDAKAGSLFWHKSDFIRAIEMGNCVIVLDEFNRLHTTLHNSLFPLLDARRSTYLEELETTIKVGPGTIFIATANIGFLHTGTHTMDSAIEDRFGFRLDVGFPTEAKERDIIAKKTGISTDLASKLARFGRDIRRKADGSGATLERPVSTRQLLKAATLMKIYDKKGWRIQSALEYTIVPFYSKDGGLDSEQAQVLQLIQGIFG